MKQYIIPALMFIAVLILTLANMAYASGSHHDDGAKGDTGAQGIKGDTGLRGKQGIPGKGAASAIASSQHHFYWGTNSWQGSVGIGAFDSDTAFSFGLAKRFNKTLINGNISQEDGRFGGGFGVNWNF